MNNYLKKISISGNQLKFIACILMLIDHVGYGLVYHYLQLNMMTIDPNTYTKISRIYDTMRQLGRMAAPIFAFMLVEGFFHTKSVAKYAFRLAIMAIVSELFFDLALYHQNIYMDHQNVMLTLLIGLLTIWGIDVATKIPGLSDVLKAVLTISITAAAMEIAQLTHCDYKWHAILSIVLIYLFHEAKSISLLAGAASYSWEKFAPISFLVMYFYDEGKKPNPKLKYVFYLFYPVHLLIIYLIGLGLGL